MSGYFVACRDKSIFRLAGFVSFTNDGIIDTIIGEIVVSIN